MPKTPLYLWNPGCPCCDGSPQSVWAYQYPVSGESIRQFDTSLMYVNGYADNAFFPLRTQRLILRDGFLYYMNLGARGKVATDLGSAEWTDSTLSFNLYDAALDASGDYLYLSHSALSGSGYCLTKIDTSDGSVVSDTNWPFAFSLDDASQTTGKPSGQGVGISPSGTIFLGHSPEDDGSSYPTLSELDTDGNVLNQWSFDQYDFDSTPNFQRPLQIIWDSDGNMYVTLTRAHYLSPTTYLDWVKKFNTSMTEVWGLQNTSTNTQYPDVCALTSDESRLVAGFNFDVGQFTNSADSIYSINTSDGSLEWSLASPNNKRVTGIAAGDNNTVFVSVHDNTASVGNDKKMLQHLDIDGNELASYSAESGICGVAYGPA